LKQYFHSVRLDKEQCKGCTNCIKRCPTEAIRVRDGKARIIEELCVDCGECIRTCPNHAKIAVEDFLDKLKDFKHKIALPAPSFYGQFDSKHTLDEVLEALLMIGFDDVFEVALAAEVVTRGINNYLQENQNLKPLISQACPAVVGLIQVRFPLLLEHIIPIDSPMNMAAMYAKRNALSRGYAPEEVGTFFITPCPGKITAIRQPAAKNHVYVDGAISISTIYGQVLKHIKDLKGNRKLQKASGLGIGWGSSGGEIKAVKHGTKLAVDGIHNVINVLEQVEKGELRDIAYLECQACQGGCIGGSLVAKNPFLARVRIDQLVNKGTNPQLEHLLETVDLSHCLLKGGLQPRKVRNLDENLAEALVKMEKLERTLEELPGLDCSSCGCPNCRALAEDIVKGLALETDCVFKLRKQVEILAEEVLKLARKVPPAMGQRN